MKKIPIQQCLIEIDPNRMGGAPCLAGTRITVKTILWLVNAGWSIKDICSKYYPQLRIKEVRRLVKFKTKK